MEAQAFTPPDTAVEQDEDDDINIEIAPYPDWCDEAEQRRAFVLSQFSASDIAVPDPVILLGNMQMFVEWLVNGTIPKKRKLEAVK